MNIAEEFSKIRFAFSKVRENMDTLYDKITVNYEDFMNHHKKLSNEVSEISSKLKFVLDKLHEEKTHKIVKSSPKDLSAIKAEIKLLKQEVVKSQNSHNNISLIIDEVKKNKSDIKQ